MNSVKYFMENSMSILKNNTSLLLVTIVFIALLVLVDGHRFAQQSQYKVEQVNEIAIREIALPTISSERIAELKEIYSRYEVIEQESTDNNVMSLNEQNNQQGDLTTLFVGDTQLYLKAVVKFSSYGEGSKEEYYVLLEEVDIKTENREVKKYHEGDDVLGYQLSVLNNQQVTLKSTANSADAAQTVRVVNLNMYKKANSHQPTKSSLIPH